MLPTPNETRQWYLHLNIKPIRFKFGVTVNSCGKYEPFAAAGGCCIVGIMAVGLSKSPSPIREFHHNALTTVSNHFETDIYVLNKILWDFDNRKGEYFEAVKDLML